MEKNVASGRSTATRRAFLSASAATAVAAPLLINGATAQAATASARRHFEPDPGLRQLVSQIDPDRLRATIERLVAFGTRHTESSQTDPVRGIGAATNWVFQQFQTYAAASNGNMTVQRQSYVQQPVPGRILNPVTITNVIATLKGTASPARYYVVTGHLDSRVSDVTNSTLDAPGADDDGSGVAVALELARLFATQQFPGTLVFATVAGEEQGLFGSGFMAAQMKAAGLDVQGMFSNDIVGASHSFDGHPAEPRTLRLFVEGIPQTAQPGDVSLIKVVGGENDGATRQLARFVDEAAPFDLTGMDIRIVWRRDRFLRASDHVSFQLQGYPAARFTEQRENFAHEHQDVRVENGQQFGDLIDFVDFDYTARVARVNGAALWALATAPATPKNAQIHTTPPAGFPGTNLTTLTWNANPESDIAGYQVAMRETTAPQWTDFIDVGNVTTVTLDISKDNVQFGIRAVDQAGHASPVAFPLTVN